MDFVINTLLWSGLIYLILKLYGFIFRNKKQPEEEFTQPTKFSGRQLSKAERTKLKDNFRQRQGEPAKGQSRFQIIHLHTCQSPMASKHCGKAAAK